MIECGPASFGSNGNFRFALEFQLHAHPVKQE
jgi:hypothetical protein